MKRSTIATIIVVTILSSCKRERGTDLTVSCEKAREIGRLASDLREASGLAASRTHHGVFWMHNDSGSEPVLYSTDEAGKIEGRIRVPGATNVDWEDVAVAPCATGNCVFIADIGDNSGRRSDAAIYSIPEPARGDTVTARATRIPVRYATGPQDAEALYALPNGSLFVVTKGRNRGITLYRVGTTPQNRALTALQTITEQKADLGDQVTGAAASPNGKWVALRTYSTIRFYRANEDGTLAEIRQQGLWPELPQLQSEGIALLDDGRVILTTEADPAGDSPVLEVRCRLPA
jgi:hypothetical protein